MESPPLILLSDEDDACPYTGCRVNGHQKGGYGQKREPVCASVSASCGLEPSFYYDGGHVIKYFLCSGWVVRVMFLMNIIRTVQYIYIYILHSQLLYWWKHDGNAWWISARLSYICMVRYSPMWNVIMVMTAITARPGVAPQLSWRADLPSDRTIVGL